MQLPNLLTFPRRKISAWSPDPWIPFLFAATRDYFRWASDIQGDALPRAHVMCLFSELVNAFNCSAGNGFIIPRVPWRTCWSRLSSGATSGNGKISHHLPPGRPANVVHSLSETGTGWRDGPFFKSCSVENHRFPESHLSLWQLDQHLQVGEFIRRY